MDAQLGAGQVTTFIENAADYLGETVTVTPRHALDGDRLPAVCACHPDCRALVVADGPLAGRDFDRDNYDGRHQWQVRRHRRSPWGVAS